MKESGFRFGFFNILEYPDFFEEYRARLIAPCDYCQFPNEMTDEADRGKEEVGGWLPYKSPPDTWP